VDWFGDALRNNPALALFLALALGYFAGTVRIGRFQLSPMVGTLLAGLVVGQLGVPVPAAMKTVFFFLFVFAIGFRTGADFFRSLRSSGVSMLALTVLLNVLGLSMTWGFAHYLKLDGGTAAGLLAGSMTNSTALGAATTAAAGLPLDEDARTRVASNVATTYALTYLFGLLLLVWFLPNVGPRLMRSDLREASREVQKAKGATSGSVNSAYKAILTRAYKLPQEFSDRTVHEIEHSWPADQRVIVARVRRMDTLLEASPEMRLLGGDVVALAGRSAALVSGANPFTIEVDDPELLAIPTVSGELVLTNRELSGQTLQEIAHRLGARGIFLTGLRRGGLELPFSGSTVIERGDILSVSGTASEVARVATEFGYAEYPTSSTDMFLVATTILVGGFIGLPALTLGRFTLRLTAPVGVLLAGLTLGYLRSINPRFGRVPEAAVSLFGALGLSGFLALVGIEAAEGIHSVLRNSGVTLLGAAAAITLVPQIITILVGYYFVRMNPAVLLGLCAGAGTSAPALAAVEKAAGNESPSLGYGLACAIGNVLTAMSATLLVLTM